MKGMMKYLWILAFGVFLAGCGSSKKAAYDPIYDANPQEVKEEKAQKESVPSKKPTWDEYGITVTKDDDKELYEELEGWLGVPYKYAGHDKSGTDCSGLVMEVYLKVYEKKLHRNSAKMQEECEEIAKEELTEGDLVFFATGLTSKINHLGLYLKDDKFVHAGSKGLVVSELGSEYYTKHFVSAGRVEK